MFQLGSLIWLGTLQNQAEDELLKATKAKRISDTINDLSNDVFYALAMHGAEQADFKMPESSVLRRLDENIKDHYRNLKKLTADDQTRHKIVLKSERAGMRTMELLSQIDASLKRSEELEHEHRKPLWKELRANTKALLSSELLKLGKDQKRFAESSPEVQAILRQQIQQAMVLAGGVNLIVTLFAATYLTQGFANKVRRLTENTVRLASDVPLYPVLTGADELARLDQVFHEMAAELKAARRKERSLIDNARDLICSINAAGKLTAVNPAAKYLTGYESDELLLTPVIDLVSPTSAAEFLENLERVKLGGENRTFETELRDKNGSIVAVLFSAHYSQEEESTFCVVHDITERKEAERLRHEVVAMVTHDLRTPLTTVRNILDFMDSGKFGAISDSGKKYISSGIRNVKRMTSLVNDLLDIEKLKSGRMQLQIATVELARCLETSKELHLGIIDEEGMNLVVDSIDAQIEADEEKLQRLLSNLVANAIKFSPRGGTVQVSVEREEADLVISIADEGPGLPPEMLEVIFERFFQAETSAGKSAGSGLGLTIAKAIAEAHEFQLWAESEEGNGCRLKLRVPSDRIVSS